MNFWEKIFFKQKKKSKIENKQIKEIINKPTEYPIQTTELINEDKTTSITVIDFETANYSFSSACSIGIAIIKDNKIIEKFYSLIKPPNNEYLDNLSLINGITAEQTENEQEFPIVWEKIKKYFDSTYVAAHNASFDVRTLKATLLYYNLTIPNFKYMDTIKISELAISNNEIVKKGLSYRCNYYGVPLEEHHNSLCDAVAAANLILTVKEKLNVNDLNDFIDKYVDLKSFDNLIVAEKNIYNSFHNHINISKLKENVVESKAKHKDLMNRSFAFTGELESMDRKKAMEIVLSNGGSVHNSITKNLDYLVCTTTKTTTKVLKALDEKRNGSNLQIINEEKFLEMLNS